MSDRLIKNDKIVFQDDDSVDTEYIADIPVPEYVTPDNRYQMMVENVSTVTNVSISANVVWTDIDDNEHITEVDTYTINSETEVAIILEGIFMGDKGRLVFSNDTALGGTDGFTMYYQIREV